jgi:hypothetical protein
MRLGLTAVAALAMALGLAACGGGSESTATGVSTTIHVPPKPAGKGSAGIEYGEGGGAPLPLKRRVAVRPLTRSHSLCPGSVGIFVDALEGLRRELEIGLSYEQYGGEIDTIRKDYDRIPVKKLSLGCLRAAGTPSERAFDRYVAAANTWNACASKPGCGSATIETPLQKEWHIAARFLAEAKRGLQ